MAAVVMILVFWDGCHMVTQIGTNVSQKCAALTFRMEGYCSPLHPRRQQSSTIISVRMFALSAGIHPVLCCTRDSYPCILDLLINCRLHRLDRCSAGAMYYGLGIIHLLLLWLFRQLPGYGLPCFLPPVIPLLCHHVAVFYNEQFGSIFLHFTSPSVSLPSRTIGQAGVSSTITLHFMYQLSYPFPFACSIAVNTYSEVTTGVSKQRGWVLDHMTEPQSGSPEIYIGFCSAREMLHLARLLRSVWFG